MLYCTQSDISTIYTAIVHGISMEEHIVKPSGSYHSFPGRRNLDSTHSIAHNADYRLLPASDLMTPCS